MNMMKKKITVHIVDDHEIIIDGLTAILESENDIKVVGHSLNGKEVINWFQDHSADVLILDINMPEVGGLEVLKHFEKRKNAPHLIVLSSYDDSKLIRDVLRLGAKGFVPKKSAGEHIVKAIFNVVKGKQYFSEEVQEKLMNSLMGNTTIIEKNPEDPLLSSLTKREREVLNLITQELTTKQISDKLFISPSTVETHRKNLSKKLNVKNSIGLAIYALKNDLI